MRLCIDASNLTMGGGLTHLVELLRVASPQEFGFESVVIWAPQMTLNQIDERPWLVKRTLAVLERNFLIRAWWQRTSLGALASADECDILFVPGGSFATSFRPVVVMSRNMLPFELTELRRFGFSVEALRLLLLRWSQSRSLRSANGIIFLTRYAHDAVLKVTGILAGKVKIIPHGIHARFMAAARDRSALERFSEERPMRVVYVSIVHVFKHQWNVAEAIARLRTQGYPMVLELIGPAYPPALRRLRKTLQRIDPQGVAVRYLGPQPYSEVHASYARADVAVFASSCENMPNILLEAMASGLPVACSNRGPMPEVLGDAGAYFDPEDIDSIAATLLSLFLSAELRASLAKGSFDRVRHFSWERCATETFAFLSEIAARSTASALQ